MSKHIKPLSKGHDGPALAASDDYWDDATDRGNKNVLNSTISMFFGMGAQLSNKKST